MVERTAFNPVTPNAKSTARNTPSDLRFQQAALRPRSESALWGTSKRRGGGVKELKELKAQLAALCEGPERDGRDPDEGARGLCQGEG